MARGRTLRQSAGRRTGRPMPAMPRLVATANQGGQPTAAPRRGRDGVGDPGGHWRGHSVQFLNLARQREFVAADWRAGVGSQCLRCRRICWPRCPVSWQANPQMAQTLAQSQRISRPGKGIETELRSEIGGLAKNRGGRFSRGLAQVGPDRASCEQCVDPTRAGISIGGQEARWMPGTSMADVSATRKSAACQLSRAEAIAAVLNATNGVERSAPLWRKSKRCCRHWSRWKRNRRALEQELDGPARPLDQPS